VTFGHSQHGSSHHRSTHRSQGGLCNSLHVSGHCGRHAAPPAAHSCFRPFKRTSPSSRVGCSLRTNSERVGTRALTLACARRSDSRTSWATTSTSSAPPASATRDGRTASSPPSPQCGVSIAREGAAESQIAAGVDEGERPRPRLMSAVERRLRDDCRVQQAPTAAVWRPRGASERARCVCVRHDLLSRGRPRRRWR
jgi:hypothetical protein